MILLAQTLLKYIKWAENLQENIFEKHHKYYAIHPFSLKTSPSGPAKNILQPKPAHNLLWSEVLHYLTSHDLLWPEALHFLNYLELE